MFTYLKEDGILFTYDFMNSHLATSELFAHEEAVYREAKRYYAEIMISFRSAIKKNLEKIRNLRLEIVAPSHGPIFVGFDVIINAYKGWVSDEMKNLTIIPYVSMYGKTSKMVDYLVSALIKRGIGVKPFNLTRTDIGELALVDAATAVIASLTVLAGPHPSVVHAAYLINLLRPKLKFVSIIGSYGWGGRTVEFMKGILSNLKAEFIEPVIVRGFPRAEDLKTLDVLVEEIYERHKRLAS